MEEFQKNNFYTRKKVLVTGGAGSIGSELCRKLCKSNVSEIILCDINENKLYLIYRELKRKTNANVIPKIVNIRDKEKLKGVFEQYRPDIVFHAAALKQVPLLESNIVEGIKTNIFGTKNLLDIADNYEVEKFIYISTDKAVKPTNVMGATKRVGEILISQFSSNMTKLGVRFGNVYGSSGSVVPLFEKQICNGGPVTLTHSKAKRFFMSKSEAANLLLKVGNIGKNKNIYILNMGEAKPIKKIAEDLIKNAGYKVGKDIKIEYIGLREGEKIKEELFYPQEKTELIMNGAIYEVHLKKLKIDAFWQLRKIEKEIQSGISDIDIKERLYRFVSEINRTFKKSKKIK
ncbi:SDR family NAD(P)-dependent oxidoreductase [Halanaerobaculum tunisiense]